MTCVICIHIHLMLIKRLIRLRLFYIWITLILLGCSNDEIGLTEFECAEGNFECNVDVALASYVNDFFEEAEARGNGFPRDNIIAEFVDEIVINGIGFSGRGWSDYDGTGQKKIEILRNAWGTMNESQREILVFHELGHALLSRGHRNSRFPNCDRASVMCGDVCDGFRTIYTQADDQRRTYYLDELFDPCIEFPDWATAPPLTNSVIFLTDEISIEHENWNSILGENTVAGISDSVAFSGQYSLAIDAGVQEITHSSVWRYDLVEFPGGVFGSNFKVRAKVKAEEVVGTWAMSLQARNSDDRLIFNENTLACHTLDGTTEFEAFELNHYCFENDIEKISFVIGFIGGTTGTIYIDDLQFIYEK